MMNRRLSLLLGVGLALNPLSAVLGSTMLFDFGADATQTTGGVAGPAITWNNVTAIVEDGVTVLEDMLTTEGASTGVSLVGVSRFNGANENGTTAVSLYPATATRDSLFGNTELFSGLENVTPIFKLAGLSPDKTYTFLFYASRLGVSDNRETRYTVTGATESFVDLDAANNSTNQVRVSSVAPDAAGEISIALTPGPNNNNANHFVYLGVLEITASSGEKILVDFGAGGSITEVVEQPASAAWNNITATIGSSDTNALDALVLTNGTQTTTRFEMISRFNGANANGATGSTNFPTTATQDSLFGNTETFSGLSNIFPAFKLTGLDPSYTFSFTFYGSRTGVSDNRETRYTVTGAGSASAVLNTANNTNAVVKVSDIRPTAAGEISVALSPGANNNNANHFTYLGVMQVDFVPVRSPRILIDFGAAGSPTDLGTDDPDNTWNNVSTDIGATDSGSRSNLFRTDGQATSISLQMVSRFNGANENGTTTGELYPVDATRDSLYGNTELFGELENVTPIFKLTGLNPSIAYDLQFYASRLGVGDNRETRYTVTGTREDIVDLNVANNETEFASVTNLNPTSAGEITIALTPGPNNDNANHFVYLGVLQLDWAAGETSVIPTLSSPAYTNGVFRLTVNGTAGKTYTIKQSTNLTVWSDAQTVTLTAPSQEVSINAAARYTFYRALEQ